MRGKRGGISGAWERGSPSRGGGEREGGGGAGGYFPHEAAFPLLSTISAKKGENPGAPRRRERGKPLPASREGEKGRPTWTAPGSFFRFSSMSRGKKLEVRGKSLTRVKNSTEKEEPQVGREETKGSRFWYEGGGGGGGGDDLFPPMKRDNKSSPVCYSKRGKGKGRKKFRSKGGERWFCGIKGGVPLGGY